MTRNDMLDIIRAAQAVETVNYAIELLTGSSINGKLDDLNRLIDVIRRNKNSSYGYCEDGKQDNANYAALMELLQNESLSAEEIYAKVNREREELEAAKREYAIAEERHEKREEKAYRQGAEDILGVMCQIIDGRDVSDYEKYYMSLVHQAYSVIEKARAHQEDAE